MPSHAVYFDLTDTADERFDPIIEWLLIGLLAFMPLALGGVHAWSEAIIVAGAAVMVACLVVKLLVRPDVRFVWSWTYVPIGIFVLLAALQLVPLPSDLASMLSRQTVLTKSELLAHVPEGVRHLDHIALSFYPEATKHNLRLLIAVAAVFIVAVNVLRRLEQVRRILAAVAIIGTAVALLALVQIIFDADKIYFLIPIYSEQAHGGPFVNHSHFAQFMNLSMGAAIGLLLIHVGQLPRRRREQLEDASAVARHLTRPMTHTVWALACATVVMAVTVPMSLSRGGILSMALAGALTAAVMATRRGMRHRAWLLVAIVALAFVGVLAFQFDTVVQRVATMRDLDTLHGRTEILRDVAVAWRAFPVLGTGLGTFDAVFPYFDRSDIVSRATHAENEYAQLLMETGVVGASLALAFLVILALAYARCVRTSPSPMAAAAIGLGYGLVAILAHSVTDFGQHIPANACLTALYGALLLNLAHAAKLGRGAAPRVVFRGRLWPRAAGAAAAAAMLGIVWFDALDAARAERHWRAAQRMETYLAQRDWNGTDDDFFYLIVPAAEAARIRPKNIEYAQQLNYFRWKSISPQRAAHGFVMPDDARLGHAQRIVDELLAAAWRCPTHGPTYMLAGQIERWIDPASGRGEALVRLGHRLAPTNPGAVFEIAMLEAEAGQWDDAMRRFSRSVALGGGLYRAAAVDALLGALGRADLAVDLAGEDVDALRQVANELDRRKLDPDLANRARARAEELILARAEEPGASANVLAEAARVYAARQDPQRAIDLYRRALHHEYGRADWRLDLARLLASVGRTNDAIQEARIVQRGTRMNSQAEALIAELSAKPNLTTTAPHATAPPAPATSPAAAPPPDPTPATTPATDESARPSLLIPPPRQ